MDRGNYCNNALTRVLGVFFFRVFLKQISKQILFRVKQLSLIKTIFQMTLNTVPWGMIKGQKNSATLCVMHTLAYDVITTSQNYRFHVFILICGKKAHVAQTSFCTSLNFSILVTKLNLNFSSDHQCIS